MRDWNARQGCRDAHHTLLGRRSFLQVGSLGLGGLSLADVMRAEAATSTSSAKSSSGRPKSVIILWMRGGPSHIDMWDTKPDAPAEFRGEFDTISTNVPGIQISDMLPNSAKVMHLWSIVRSLNHLDAGHSTGDQACFTGYPPGQNADTNYHPSCGSIAAEQLQHLNPRMPAYVMIPKMVPGTNSAYLGVACKPFETIADPAAEGRFQVPNFALAEGLTVERLGHRSQLLSSFDSLRREIDSAGHMKAMDQFNGQALEILCSPDAQRAFDLDAEPASIRDRYGFHPAFDPGSADRCGAPAWSQRILLARRLVEAGVRIVTVDLRWWDTHVKGFDSLRRGFLPRWDQAFPALLTDLQERGLMESTLVVAWGEFGRTPRVNANAGRDHYPNVFSAALAGGPIKGGRVLGSSDDKGAFPRDMPKKPQDVLATIYRHLGIDMTKHYRDASGRPIQVLPFGSPITELS